MGLRVRIDSAVIDSTGAVNITVTSGFGALPSGSSNNVISFSSVADLVTSLQNYEDGVDVMVPIMYMLSAAYKLDNTLANVSDVDGDTMEICLTSGVNLINVT